MKIITTVGSSIFTNITKRSENNAISDKYTRLEEEPAMSWEALKSRIESLKKETQDAWLIKKNNNDSAEIESLLAIKKELKEEKIEVYLLATDTVVSALACLLIKDWFKDKPQFSFKIVKKDENKKNITEDLTEDNIEMLVIKNLRIFSDSSTSVDSDNKIDDDTINSGFLNLIDKIWDIIKKTDKQDCILNISGGYKASIPILTIMGQLYNIPLKYIYEGSDQLVSIDRFPINFDWEIVDLFMPYLNDLSSVPTEIINQLKNFHLIKENKTELSSMGKLLKKFFDKEMPTSRKVIGYFVEYKLYEYFHKYCSSVYSNIERSVSISIGDSNAEIDLQLTSQNEEILACEVKTFNQVKNYFSDKILKPAKKRISIYKDNGNILKGYILIFYKLKGQSIDESILKDLQSMESSLEVEIFKACYLDLPLTNDNDGINYEKFVQHALKKEDLKEINLI